MSRNAVAIVSSLLFVVLAAALVLAPVPYVAMRPGQTIDVLAVSENRPVIEVAGLPTFGTTGKLLMTTVSTTRADASLSLPEAVFVYLADDSDALPRDSIYPPGKSPDQLRNEAVAMMDTSRSNATVAALGAAGVAVTKMPRIQSVVLSGPSAGKLQPGDLIVAVDGAKVENRDEVEAQIIKHSVGDPISFTILREDKESTVKVTSGAHSADARRPVVGVSIDTGYHFAPRVAFGVDPSVTGPSAGLVFALGIYDRITEGELIGDRTVAGTGTINPAGQVGAIGGIREKVKGAERDGASIFLVPENNCAALKGVKTPLSLVKVGTLKDAIAALQLINEGNASEVATCG